MGVDSRERDEFQQTAKELTAIAQKLVVERTELQDAAVQLAKWQTEHSVTQTQHQKHLEEINGSISGICNDLGEMKVDLATVKTKLALWSTVGALGGGALVTLALKLGVGA